jgi:hypothetical protein
VPVAVRYAASRLTVAVPSGFEGRSQLALPFVELREPSPGKPVDLQIVESGGKIELLRGDGSLVPIPAGAGQPPLEKIDAGKDAAAKLVRALESHQRQAQLRALSNRDSATRATVTLHVRPVETKGEEIVRALPELARGAQVPFGTKLEFLVENRGDKPLLPVIFDLGVDGSVTQLYPHEGRASEVVRPRSTLALGPLGVFEQGPPAGPGTFKLIATEQAVNFRGLETDRADGGVQELVGSIMGSGTRADVVVRRPEKWGTDVLEVQLVEAAQ